MKNKNKKGGFKRLSLDERIQIEIQYSQGKDLGEIAKHLGKGRNKSTISREIGGRPRKGSGKYRAYQANCRAVEKEDNRGKRKRLKKRNHTELRKRKVKNWMVT